MLLQYRVDLYEICCGYEQARTCGTRNTFFYIRIEIKTTYLSSEARRRTPNTSRTVAVTTAPLAIRAGTMLRKEAGTATVQRAGSVTALRTQRRVTGGKTRIQTIRQSACGHIASRSARRSSRDAPTVVLTRRGNARVVAIMCAKRSIALVETKISASWCVIVAVAIVYAAGARRNKMRIIAAVLGTDRTVIERQTDGRSIPHQNRQAGDRNWARRRCLIAEASACRRSRLHCTPCPDTVRTS